MSQNSRKKTNVLITGSSGFIGKILAKRFSKKYKTYLIDKIKKGKQKNFYLINLKDKKKLNEFFSNNLNFGFSHHFHLLICKFVICNIHCKIKNF